MAGSFEHRIDCSYCLLSLFHESNAGDDKCFPFLDTDCYTLDKQDKEADFDTKTNKLTCNFTDMKHLLQYDAAKNYSLLLSSVNITNIEHVNIKK